MNKELVSLIIPCYNEEQVLPILKDALLKVMDEMYDFEFLQISESLFIPSKRESSIVKSGSSFEAYLI